MTNRADQYLPRYIDALRRFLSACDFREQGGLDCRCERGHDDCAVSPGGPCFDDLARASRRMEREAIQRYDLGLDHEACADEVLHKLEAMLAGAAR